MNDVAKWIGIVLALLGSAVSYGVTQEKVKQLEADVKDQKELKEQTIRMEERQVRIQQDVQKILNKLEGN